MNASDPFQSAVEELKKIQKQLEEEGNPPNISGDLKETVFEKYQAVYSLEHLPKLTEAEFRSFLPFRNNQHWSGLARNGPRMCRDMPALRRNLELLLHGDGPLAERYDEAVSGILGMGKAVATAVMHVTHPDKYSVWNRKSQEALQLVGLWPDTPRGTTDGQIYEQLNQTCLDLAQELGVDLWTLDVYWHFVLVWRHHAAADLEDDDFESQPVSEQEAAAQEVQNYIQTLTSPADAEKQLWEIANNLPYSRQQYFIPVIGLIFLRYLDHQFAQTEAEVDALIAKMSPRRRSGVDRGALFQATGVHYLPEESRFAHLVQLAQQADTADLGRAVNSAIDQIEAANVQLRDIISKEFDRLDGQLLASLIKTIGQMRLDEHGENLQRMYQTFLSQLGYDSHHTTPQSISTLITQILRPTNGRILDPAVGTGGLLIAMAGYATAHGYQDEIALYGQELNSEVIRIAKMNLVLNGFEADIRLGNSLTTDPYQSIGRFRYAIADVPAGLQLPEETDLADDPRYPFGLPRTADFLWLQQIYTALDDNGRGAAITLGGATQRLGKELEIRRKLVETGHIEALVMLPEKMLDNTALSPMLWLFNKKHTADNILLIDGRKLFQTDSQKRNSLSHKQLQFLADIVQLFNEEPISKPLTNVPFVTDGQTEKHDFAALFPQSTYQDVVGLCKAVSLADIEAANWVLTPSRYVGDDNLLQLSDLLGKESGLNQNDFQGLGELATEIKPFNGLDNEANPSAADNSLFFTLTTPTAPVVINPADLAETGDHLQLILDKAKVLAAYAAHILNSQHGVRLRQFSQSGSTLNRLTQKQIEKIQIPVLLLADQQAILETRRRLQEFEVTIGGLRNRLYSEPFKLEEVQKALELFEGNQKGTDEPYQVNDKPQALTTLSLDQWIESLPYPLATILRTYTADPSPKGKVGHLFRFFEAFSEFLTMILIGGVKNDNHYYEETIRPKMTKSFEKFETWYQRPSFGSWVSVWGFFAKRIRNPLKQPNEREAMLSRFGQPDPSFLTALTHADLNPVLWSVNKLRNDIKGHGGYMDDETAPQQLQELEEALVRIRELIGPAFQTVQMLRPIPNTMGFSNGRFTCQAERFHSSSTYFTPETIETTVPLDHDKLYLWTGEHADPIELPPLIRLHVEKNQIDCYFYNGSDRKKGSREITLVKWVCYHVTNEPNQKIEDPAYLQALDALLTVQPKT